MEALSNLAAALELLISDPRALLYIAFGAFVGLSFGALPGLTATMGVALLLPITFNLPPVVGLGMLLGVYVGGIAGGAIPAILLNIPGTPSAVVTTLDGHPMAKNGQAPQALGWALIASLFGGLFSWVALATVAPQLARVGLRFGPAEYAALALFGLTIIAGVSSGNLIKGLLAGLLGLALSFFGVDPITGHMRFTFGSIYLMSGIAIMPALIGFFAIPEILSSLGSRETRTQLTFRLRDFFPSRREFIEALPNFLRSGLIGTLIGIVPATGGNIASFLAYDQARRASRRGPEFGRGNPDGVVASEAANNGVTGAALIPLLTLGIPGDSVTAVLLGGLMIHGLQPGPRLFHTNPDIVYGVFAAFVFANLFMAVIQLFGMRVFVQMLRVPRHYLTPILLVLAIVGAYALNNSWFDVWVMLVLGLFGYVMTLAGFPMAPIVLGLVLGPILESEARRALVISGGDWTIFLTRPIPAVLLLFSLAVVFGPVVSRFIRQWRAQAAEG